MKKASQNITKKISENILLPTIINLRDNLYILSFRVMKLLPAHYILEKAKRMGKINDKTIVAETSSGSFAFGLATISCEMGLKFHIVSDNQMDTNIMSQIHNLGGTIEIVKPVHGGGAQKERLIALQ